MSDLIEIISLVLNLLFGGTLLFQFLTFRSYKKKIEAEADGARAASGKAGIDLVNDTVTTMVNTVNSLMLQNKDLIDKYTGKSEEVETLKQEKDELEQKIAQLEKRVNRMIQTNLKVIKVLEQLSVEEDIISQLRAEQ